MDIELNESLPSLQDLGLGDQKAILSRNIADHGRRNTMLRVLGLLLALIVTGNAALTLWILAGQLDCRCTSESPAPTQQRLDNLTAEHARLQGIRRGMYHGDEETIGLRELRQEMKNKFANVSRLIKQLSDSDSHINRKLNKTAQDLVRLRRSEARATQELQLNTSHVRAMYAALNTHVTRTWATGLADVHKLYHDILTNWTRRLSEVQGITERNTARVLRTLAAAGNRTRGRLHTMNTAMTEQSEKHEHMTAMLNLTLWDLVARQNGIIHSINILHMKANSSRREQSHTDVALTGMDMRLTATQERLDVMTRNVSELLGGLKVNVSNIQSTGLQNLRYQSAGSVTLFDDIFKNITKHVDALLSKNRSTNNTTDDILVKVQAVSQHTVALRQSENLTRALLKNITAKTKRLDRDLTVLRGVRLACDARQTNCSESGGRGRVEVRYKGEWGTVCDDNFEVNAAKVVCRQLGYSTGTPKPEAYFGAGRGNVMLDDVECGGFEYSLRACRNRGWNVHDCGHNEDVGVICS